MPIGRHPGPTAARWLAPAASAIALSLAGPAPLPGQAWLPRYDLSAAHRATVRLPRALGEISGLALDERGRLLAHTDETATLYRIDPKDGAVVGTVPMTRTRGDFEGVAVAGDRVFLITSRGTLLELRASAEGGLVLAREVRTGLDRLCELEGLAFDRATMSLLLPCKNPYGKVYEDRLVIFAVAMADLAAEREPRLIVPYAAIARAGGEKRFHPSSIEVHPGSGSLFLVSATDHTILELSRDGGVLAAHRLPSRVHPQPEGLTFGPDLALWIADEGGGGRATLTRYPVTAGGSRP